MKTSRKLTIFEGPDGSGKTTAAMAFAVMTGAQYIHFGPDVDTAEQYAREMLPVLFGKKDIVFDRCWMSERPYGIVYREGQDRLSSNDRAVLEHLAHSCNGFVIRCQPAFETVARNYWRNKTQQMLDNEFQLRRVYDLYLEEPTTLPWCEYDYTEMTVEELWAKVATRRMQ